MEVRDTADTGETPNRARTFFKAFGKSAATVPLSMGLFNLVSTAGHSIMGLLNVATTAAAPFVGLDIIAVATVSLGLFSGIMALRNDNEAKAPVQERRRTRREVGESRDMARTQESGIEQPMELDSELVDTSVSPKADWVNRTRANAAGNRFDLVRNRGPKAAQGSYGDYVVNERQQALLASDDPHR